MKIGRTVALVAMGVGGTLLYQQIKSGNMKKCIKDIERFAKRTCDDLYEDLEDMM